MKSLLATAIVILTCNAFSQTASSTPQESLLVNKVVLGEITVESDTTIIKIDPSLPNGIMLHGTQMVIVKNGIMRRMKKDVVLANGTRIRTDGFVFRKNKYEVLLNFGEYVDASGNILPIVNINSATK